MAVRSPRCRARPSKQISISICLPIFTKSDIKMEDCGGPTSLRICAPSFLAWSAVPGDIRNRIPSTSRSTLRSFDGILIHRLKCQHVNGRNSQQTPKLRTGRRPTHGFGPAPARAIISPQNTWSPKKGTTSVGRPFSSPIAVVPAPPWWTTADIFVKR